ncbi:MAG: sigma-54-dependent Fis family transcriptional regulator [Nitrospinota bacterium]|nr:MAG: sigma-54-dependent Fis family transcriptional regulator [Nitrospinota bacterium]
MSVSKILIVDDDPTQLELCREIFQLMKAEVACASSGEEAIERLKEERFDVIVSDLVMPGMNGIDLLMAVQQRGLNIPVIIITGYADMENAEECLHLGSFDYIAKPYDPYLLQATVRRALYKQGRDREWRLEHQRKFRKEAVKTRLKFPHIIGQSAKMQEVFAKVSKVAESNANVCIYGESGTGKELIARAIHYNSARKDRPLVTLDCTAIPEGLMESEMFGHVKGAFTSAATEREGVFQLADTGTLFLDEIGELSLPLQAKLLRVIQCREFRKVGGTKPIKVDVRIIAATNKDLYKAVQEGTFREDLFYRIEVIPITIPPLRERKEDIPLLVDFFIEKFNRQNKKAIKGVSSRTLTLLLRYDWPGNVRELENCIERAVVMADSDIIDVEDLSTLIKNAGAKCVTETNGSSHLSLKQVEKEHILRVLNEVNGNKTQAAKLLGISLRGLQYKLKAFEAESALHDQAS